MTIEEIKKEFEASPYLRHLGVEILRFEEGDVEIKLQVEPRLLNRNDVVHGGVYASVMDLIQKMHLQSVTKTKCKVNSSIIHFTAPLKEGAIYAKASILSRSYKTAFVDGVLTDGNGKLVSRGTGTYKIIR
ncbi:PaaI family thioesterase [Planococcus salinus]|uniref:PaaI family thioesterase n=1 Tax=Planococcus salinus TaxID=1848460 RepID=A0A3M8P939_9BACL|nr:PaaI family thioesterase [Planococcus salinus]RNF40216.1 PaaI family thioesterase [Planococcus salinus]